MLDGVCPKCYQTEVREHLTDLMPLSDQPQPLRGRVLVCMECGYTEIYTHTAQLRLLAQSSQWISVPTVASVGQEPVTGVTERLSPDSPEGAASAIRAASEHHLKKRCPVCHADEIIPRARVLDRSDGLNQNLSVEVTRKPGARVFRRPVVSSVRAWICGRCGHTALFAEDPEALLDAYLASKG
jgi:hypothetical protein